MNIIIPIESDQGAHSAICAHFGSAPMFAIVDTESGDQRVIQNQNHEHAHGMCQPLRAFSNETIDAMVVGGIGTGALNKLRASGIQVYLSTFATIAETLSGLDAGTLPEVTPDTACAHHGHGHGHGHGRGGCGHHHGVTG